MSNTRQKIFSKLKHIIDRYVNIANVALFTKISADSQIVSYKNAIFTNSMWHRWDFRKSNAASTFTLTPNKTIIQYEWILNKLSRLFQRLSMKHCYLWRCCNCPIDLRYQPETQIYLRHYGKNRCLHFRMHSQKTALLELKSVEKIWYNNYIHYVTLVSVLCCADITITQICYSLALIKKNIK